MIPRQEHLPPAPRHAHYLADIRRFWLAQDMPAAAAKYVPCWELVAGRRLEARERGGVGGLMGGFEGLRG